MMMNSVPLIDFNFDFFSTWTNFLHTSQLAATNSPMLKYSSTQSFKLELLGGTASSTKTSSVSDLLSRLHAQQVVECEIVKLKVKQISGQLIKFC